MRREHWAIRPVFYGAMIGGGLGMIAMLALSGPDAPQMPMPRASSQPQISLEDERDYSDYRDEEVRFEAGSDPYSGCREARAAGDAPVYAGSPHYAPWLDGDHDGIGCEPYRRR